MTKLVPAQNVRIGNYDRKRKHIGYRPNSIRIGRVTQKAIETVIESLKKREYPYNTTRQGTRFKEIVE